MADNKPVSLNIPGFDLSSFGKPTAVDPVTAAKDFINNPQALRQAAADRKAGNPLNPIAEELRNSDLGTLYKKYGPEVAENTFRITQAEQEFEREFQNRSGGEVIADTGLGVAQGAVSMAGGIAATAGGLLNDDLGVGLAKLSDAISGGIGSFKSDELQKRIAATEEIRASNKRNRENTKSDSGSPVVNILDGFGKAIRDEAGIYLEDGAMALDLTAQGSGSVGPSVGMVKLSTAALKALGIGRGAVPIGVGVSEASGTYQDGVLTVDAMSHEELMTGSEYYRDLIEAGIPKEDAKRDTANKTGLIAFRNQLAPAAALSVLSAAFERAPLRVNTIKGASQDAVTQALEEAGQGFTGEISGDLAEKQIADENKVVGEDAAASLVQGAIAGPGMVAALQGPGLAARTAVAGTKAAGEAVVKLGEIRDETLDNNSEVGDKATEERLTELETLVPSEDVPTEAVVEPVEAVTAPEAEEDLEVIEPTEEAVPEVSEAPVETTEAIQEEDPDAEIRQSLRELVYRTDDEGKPISRLRELKGIADRVSKDKDLSDAEKRTLVIDAMNAHEELISLTASAFNEVPDFIAERPDEDEIKQSYMQTKNIVDSFLQNPKVVSLIKGGETLEDTQENVTEADVTPERVNENITIAKHNPTGVNPEVIDIVLNQDSNPDSDVTLEAEDRALLEGAKALALIDRQAAAAKQKIVLQNIKDRGKNDKNAWKPMDLVKETLNRTGHRTRDINKTKVTLPSLQDYFKDITASVRGKGKAKDKFGNPFTTQSKMEELRNFGQHMLNKMEANNKSLDFKPGSNLIPFRAWAGNGWIEADSEDHKTTFAYTGSPKSLAYAKEVKVDADSIIDLYNNFLDIYPDLKGKKLTKMDLDSRIDGIEKVDTSWVQEFSNEIDNLILDNETDSSTINDNEFSEDLVSEMNDVVVLLDLLGINSSNKKQPVSKKNLSEIRQEVFAIFKEVKAGRDITEFSNKLENLFRGFGVKSVDNADRIARAKRHAVKYGDGNPEAHYLIQLTEELGEVITEIDVIKGVKANEAKENFLKRSLKAIRFKPDTVNKSSGLTNKQEFINAKRDYENAIETVAEPVGELSPEEKAKLRSQYSKVVSRTKPIARTRRAKRPFSNLMKEYGIKISEKLKREDIPDNIPADELEGYAGALELADDTYVDRDFILDMIQQEIGGTPFYDPETQADVDAEELAIEQANHEIEQEEKLLDVLEQGSTRFSKSKPNEKESLSKEEQEYEDALVEYERRKVLYEQELDDKVPAGAVTTNRQRQNVIDDKNKPALKTQDDLPLEGGKGEKPQEKTYKTASELEQERMEKAVPETLRADKEGVSRMARAFTVIPGKSLLTGILNPVTHITELFSSETTVKKNAQSEINYVIDQNKLKLLRSWITKTVADGIEKLEARVDAPLYDEKKGISFRDVMNSNSADVLGTMRGKVLNLVDAETGRYNKQMLETALIATLDWAMNAAPGGRLNDGTIAEKFGFKSKEELDPTLRDALQYGSTTTDTKEEIAKHIMEFWGLQTDSSVTLTDTKGIPEALAAEIMEVLEGSLFKKTNFIYAEEEDGVAKDHYHWTTKGTDVHKAMEKIDLKSMSSIIGDTLLKDREKTFHIGKAPEKVDNTQRGNFLTNLTAFEKKVVKNAQQIPFMRNTPFLKVMNALGEETYKTLMGSEDTNEHNTNKGHLRSIEGKNNTNDTAWKMVKHHNDLLEDYALTHDLNPDEVPTYYDWFISKVGRLHMKGFGPQGDKTAREVFVATMTNLDMTKKKNRDLFWISVGQSADLVKIENISRKEAVETAQEKMLEEYGEAVELFSEWLDNVDQDPDAAFSAESQQRLIEVMDGGADPKKIHAILATAKFLRAQALGGDAWTNFQHSLSIEADGKTDGPINSLVHFLTGKFTNHQITLLGKGGLYLNRNGLSSMEYRQESEENKVDLYEVTSRNLTGIMDNFKERVREISSKNKDDNASEVLEALNWFTDQLMGKDFQLGEDKEGNTTITFGRGFMKNPLTVTVYGSGANGIARKVGNALMDAFYQELTKARRGEDNILSDLNDDREMYRKLGLLFEGNLFYDKKKERHWYFRNSKEVDPKTGQKKKFNRIRKLTDQVKFEFDNDQRENFYKNIKYLFVDQMVEAIDEMMGGVQDVLTTMRETTNIQASVFKYEFERREEELLQQKRESGEIGKNEFLSQKDRDTLLKELAPLGAIIENEYQNLNVGTGTRANSTRKISRGLSNNSDSVATLPVPGEAGVRIAPYLTIARGDGMMINFIYESMEKVGDLLKKSFPVFDGVEIAIDKFDELSDHINESSTKGWFENPVQDAADSFETFIREFNLSDMTIDGIWKTFGTSHTSGKKTRNYVDEAIFGEFGEEPDYRFLDETKNTKRINEVKDELKPLIEASLQSHKNKLKRLAMETQARKNVMKRITFSNHHMMGSENPYTYEGGALIEGDLVEGLDALYEEELAKLDYDKNEQENQQPILKDNVVVETMLKPYMVEDVDGLEYAAMTSGQMKGFLGGMVLNKELDAVRKIVSSKTLDDFKIVIGDAETLTAYRNKHYSDKNNGKMIPEGEIDFANRIMYITEYSEETILHELVHLATFDKVLSNYTNPDDLTEKEKKAVSRLEALMKDFMNRSYEDFDVDEVIENNSALFQATEAAKKNIQLHLNKNTEEGKAIALNEFMAWSLTNQNLIDVNKQTRTHNPLAKLFAAVRKVMGYLIGGDIFSNILFNSAILTHDTRDSLNLRLAGKSPTVVLFQDSKAGENSRAASIAKLFDKKLMQYVRDSAKKTEGVDTETFPVEEQKLRSMKVAIRFQQHGFKMDNAEQAAFTMIQAAFGTGMEMDKLSLNRVQKLYDHVMRQITHRDFMENPENHDDQADENQAMEKYSILVGSEAVRKDKYERTNFLSSFLALSQTSEDFRKVLRKIAPPKTIDISYDSLNDVLASTTTSVLDGLAMRYESREHSSKNIRDSLDGLTRTLVSIEADSRSQLERKQNELVDEGNKQGKKLLERLGNAVSDFGDQLSHNEKNNIKSVVGLTIKHTASILSEEKAEGTAQELTHLMNKWHTKHFDFIPKFINEVIGITDDNKSILMLLNKGKKAVSSTRQEFREQVPLILAEKFSRDLKKDEWTALYSLAKVDITALVKSLSGKEIVGLFSGSTDVDEKIETLSKELRKFDTRRFPDYMRKSEQLANFMVTGVAGHNLLANPTAIALLLNEKKARSTKINPREEAALIDQIVTLMAVKKLDKNTKDALAKLAKEEAEGVQFINDYMYGLRNKEYAKEEGRSLITELNQFKGFVPNENKEGFHMKLGLRTNEKDLFRQGYTKVSNYWGTRHTSNDEAYYFTNVSGRGVYSQGVMQTVQSSVNGINPYTGLSVSGISGGTISLESAVSGINEELRKQTKFDEQEGREALRPVFNKYGDVVHFEKLLDPKQTEMMGRSTHLGEMLGAWAGRQEEELMSKGFNFELVKRLSEMWKNEKEENKSGYVDIYSSEDPFHKDIWNLIPIEMKRQIETYYGNKHFMVRKDLVDNALGYRNASVGNMWMGETHVSKEVRDTFKQVTTALMGNNAYKYLVTAEKGVQTVVSSAKDLIVIRSIVVPAANAMSNVMQLAAKGVPFRSIIKGHREKLVEIDAYLASEDEKIRLNAELRAAGDNPFRAQKLKIRLQAIEDSQRRMSIWPLIEEGEFNTIAEGLTELDASLTKGKFVDWVEDKVERYGKELPGPAQTTLKYATVARDTALYKGMSRMTQYGDFIAKAVLYDDLTKRQGLKHDEAHRKITDEFVNYNLLPGRGRSYAESIGLLWFWNFKIRSMKVAVRMMRDNPLSMLLFGIGGPVMPTMGLGSPLSDNLVSVFKRGTLDYSVGWDMLFGAPELNPWLNVMR